jgi:prepilin-type N-terminal cleavage/methylation domain-containing protein
MRKCKLSFLASGKFRFNQGFGLLEVLIASVVLGFLIVGLNTLQKGNREAILRIRARDAANFVAQRVLDSLGSLGIYSLKALPECGDNIVFCENEYKYYFEGKPQLDKSPNSGGIKAEIDYKVQVELFDDPDEQFTQKFEDNFATITNTYAKSLEATVSWEFKNAEQSIKVAKVVR